MLQIEILLTMIIISSTLKKLLTLKDIKIQNDILTKEMIRANGFRLSSTILCIIGSCFMIYDCMNPDTTVRTAAHVASQASHMLNRTSALVNFAYGAQSSGEDRDQGQDQDQVQEIEWDFVHVSQWEEYIDDETGI